MTPENTSVLGTGIPKTQGYPKHRDTARRSVLLLPGSNWIYSINWKADHFRRAISYELHVIKNEQQPEK